MGILIYKASAGSGKTYTLVYEYIKYMFAVLSASDIKNGAYKKQLNFHRRILAVTFTNKSTAEMKERIVLALYKMSKGEMGDYVEKLRKDVPALASVEDDAIKLLAERFLTDVLLDYTQFRVSTIDGFFQQIVRSFARELNLNNQYQVELDAKTILELAVDNMLATLTEKDEQLLNWLTDFAEDKVDSGNSSWNPKYKILSLVKLLTKESFIMQKDKFGFDLKQLNDYKDNLRKIIGKFDADLKMVCDEAKGSFGWKDGLEWFGENRISRFDYDYLKGKKYELSDSFEKGAESDDLGDWCKVKYRKKVELQPFVTKLHKCVRRIVELCKGERFREYQTAKILFSYIYVLGILNEVDNHAMEICKAKDCLMISSTSDFINKIIEDSDTPFIYEKVGVRTEHFMIDEFQDTSRLQWSNFVPLLRDAVAQGNESMIVGDVKQSIYRWRNGDWSILHEGVKKEFGSYVNDDTLSKNFRSSAEVIEFNNKIYSELPKLVDAHLKAQGIIDKEAIYLENIYADSQQGVGKKDAPKGYVRLEFLADDSEDKEQTWRAQSLNHMVEAMKKIGHYGEMAVLVRYHDDAKEVAERLKEEQIPFYSSEALCVADDVAVKFIVSVLEYLMQPYEPLFRANMLAFHREVFGGRSVNEDDYELMSYSGDCVKWERLLFGDEELAENFGRVKYMSLLTMIESLIGLFALNEVDGGLHSIYLQSFMDKVQSYAIGGTLDIRSLLEYWDIQGPNTYVAMPEGGNAVRIITVHKSKGLEFGVVFVPFMDWSMGLSTKKDNIQLVSTANKTRKNHLFIDEVSVVPINTRSSNNLLNSEFKKDIVDEYLATTLDEMNVLYVATTRASQRLYVYCNVTEPKTRSKTTTEISQISIAKILRIMLLGDNKINVYEPYEEVTYTPKHKEEVDIENIELCRNRELLPTSEEVEARAKLHFKYSEDAEGGDARRYGIMMHKMFERIITLDDIDGAIDWMAKEGEDVGDARTEIEAIMAIEGVAEMFDARWRVMNEAEIFDGKNGRIYRPDRVMIDEENREVVVVDYKFGEYTDEAHAKYQHQVERYVQLIKEMGYSARGYLLYATERKLFDLN
jgi:ATP-dependent exoDNAse (exonuclease V) beta subunit